MKHILLPDCIDRQLDFYLAMEDYVARTVEGDAFFIWQTDPTVIIGRNQDLQAEVNVPFCKEKSVNVFRRKSGGGCVYSDKGNIMLSYITGYGEAEDIFHTYLDKLTCLLCSIGLNAERSGRNDILVNGMKVSGNAFRMLPGRSIVHGTLLFDTDLECLEQAIRPPVEKLVRHGITSVRQRVANLSSFLSDDWDIGRLKDYLVSGFTDGEIMLTEEDIENIDNTEHIWKMTC